ncbi:inositol 2-dehydrogenase [Labrys wisconsinensis]|uniref:Myo-inositol 2-dehydrogenase/D-chiro-inositol 1-dehydrogenase n=1 Tax=Labrys wisconsinensis TaxID=425677 RepID=A0ABU0JKV9_9HYPH|nr:inositol 2-dehydrogenase [Labrys wisconsinensis]MDQ0474925.1 myo-inositol 2-dehydrogenase/D-chiro-inositol 1-dehydrogenase [Labrys wisconsinensis]
MVGLAVLGAGRIGKIHGRNAALHPKAKLVSVSDPHGPSADALAAETGAAVRSLEEAVTAPDIDAVLICTPTTTHADLIERAARAGKAAFCEKPVDLSSERIRTCLAVVEQAGTPLMIGFNRRFDPNFGALKRRIAEGAIGAVELVSIISRDPSPPPASYIATSGGLFRDMMIHDLDLARFLLEEDPVEVHAVGSSLVDPEIGRAGDVDTAAVLLKTASGKICQITNSRRATYGYDQRIEVHGQKGMIRAHNVPRTTVELATSAGLLADPVQDFFLERYADAYRAEMTAFVDAVTGGAAPSPSGQDGLKAQILADAATESARTGQAVRV